MQSTHTPDDIWLCAGKALFICQHIEFNLTLLCRMFKTSKSLEPRQDLSLYGNAKEHTASIRWLREALLETGIDADHYLVSELNELTKQRDWLAHRAFLEVLDTRKDARDFQFRSMEDIISKGRRLLSVLLATSKHVAQIVNGDNPIMTNNYIENLTAHYAEEAEKIFASMKITPRQA